MLRNGSNWSLFILQKTTSNDESFHLLTTKKHRHIKQPKTITHDVQTHFTRRMGEGKWPKRVTTPNTHTHILSRLLTYTYAHVTYWEETKYLINISSTTTTKWVFTLFKAATSPHSGEDNSLPSNTPSNGLNTIEGKRGS